ncbi:ArsC family reductase [Terasakiella sp. A23]|uniref:ArsC family reductase n=1 Tax=Terasakiella sp. FCG-A23 TaxID=3080561 RepID=UPI0029544A98|nr:ArsC family reductase [Terasakiella sp. A23]MDV7341640.1 ArsC family reductase [Terasakiella sp. A23]
MIKLVGLKNCDTCRKAKKWLESQSIAFEFHDVRKDGLTRDDLAAWASDLGWEALLNKRGTTWRGLDEAQKADVDEAKAIDLMAENPALMKRPVFVTPTGVILGFKQEQMDQLCQN